MSSEICIHFLFEETSAGISAEVPATNDRGRCRKRLTGHRQRMRARSILHPQCIQVYML